MLAPNCKEDNFIVKVPGMVWQSNMHLRMCVSCNWSNMPP